MFTNFWEDGGIKAPQTKLASDQRDSSQNGQILCNPGVLTLVLENSNFVVGPIFNVLRKISENTSLKKQKVVPENIEKLKLYRAVAGDMVVVIQLSFGFNFGFTSPSRQESLQVGHQALNTDGTQPQQQQWNTCL